ncbi:unnamed protein product [Orchesella dallaii]|uniref:Uncharacterized protein n=1 Tax=Orchesella dallaii TaxID=48710 RepID=A0ABP1SAQ5_9HEXA
MDEWEKLGWNSREVAKALFQASNDDKRKFISHAFEKVDSVWGRAAAILFPNKQPNESDRRFIYQIWVDNRKNVEFEYDKLSQKKRFPKKLDNVTKKGIDDDVDDEQPCVCERIIRKLPGEQRTIYLVEDVSTWHHASDGQDEDEISIDSVSSEDEDLLEDTDSDSDSQTSISEILQQMKLDNLEVLSSIHSNEVGSDGTLEGKSDDEFATDETLMYGLSAAALEELSNLREDGISDIDYETLQKFDESTKPVGKHEFPTTSHVPNVNTKEQPPYKITGIKKVQSGCKEGKQKSPEQSEDDEDFQTSVGRGSNNISAKYNSDNKSPDGLKETHDKDKYFDTSCLPKRFDMTVSAEDWRKIVVIKPNKSGTKKEHFKWHSEFSNTLRKHFHRTNKVCNPTINTKFIRNPIPIVGNFITVYMCCNEKECKTKWIFSVARNPKPNSDVLISVVGEGSMKHPKSNKGGVRWIRGKQKQGQEKVSLKFPAAERITKISSADQEQLNYGNWAEVPTLKAHQRMREKIIGKDDLHKDVAHDIAKTIPNLNERFDDKWIPGYVQIFQVYPIKIVLFTKRQMSLLKDLQNQDHDIFLQIDATGPEIWKKIPAGKVEEPKSDNVPFWKRSQFGLMAEFIFEKYNELNSEHNEFWKTKNYPPNACYSPDFLNYIKVYIAPYYPIISHAVFECCGLPVTDDTTNKIAYCNTTEANLHTEPNYKPELSESEEETKPPDKEDSDFINEEPNWDAPQVSIKRPKKCQYGKSFAKKKREVSPERELEVFKKSQKRAKSVSEISAVMGAIPFIPWGGTFRGKNNSSVPLHNTCSIDTVIQILCGLYTNVPQFQEFLRRERTIDPLALSVDCMVRQCQNGEINQAKTTWITEIMKYKPDEKGGDLQGCELEQGFGLLMPWMTINRYVMCTTENCPNYVDVSGEVNLSSALATCIKDDMRILQKRTPNQILHQLNNMTAAHISCKICNIRGVKAHEIVTNAPFLVYPVIHDKQYHFPESELDLTQTIKGKKYKVFAYTAIRGVTQKNIPNDTVIPHFVAVLLHKNKRILFNGLKDCYQDLTSDLKDSKSAYDVEGGITSVWLVPT